MVTGLCVFLCSHHSGWVSARSCQHLSFGTVTQVAPEVGVHFSFVSDTLYLTVSWCRHFVRSNSQQTAERLLLSRCQKHNLKNTAKSLKQVQSPFEEPTVFKLVRKIANERLLASSCIRRYIWSMALFGRFGQQIRNAWKVLKCGAGEGWRRSVGPIM